MDIRQMEYIIKISEECCISRAAKKLFITQSALNQQLLKLEKELGVKLFQRTERNMILTQAGEIYISNAREIVKIKEETYRRIHDMADKIKGKLSVGLLPERGAVIFSAIYPDFYSKYPDIRIIPTEQNVKDQLKGIDNGDLDIGIVTVRDQHKEGNQFIHICNEEFLLVVPVNHPLAYLGSSYPGPYPSIALDQFKNDPFLLVHRSSTMRDIVDDFFIREGLNPNILIESLRCQTLLTLAEQGLGCTILPSCYIKDSDRVVYFSLPAPNQWEIAVAYRKGGYLSVAEKEIIHLIRQYFINLESTKGPFVSYLNSDR